AERDALLDLPEVIEVRAEEHRPRRGIAAGEVAHHIVAQRADGGEVLPARRGQRRYAGLPELLAEVARRLLVLGRAGHAPSPRRRGERCDPGRRGGGERTAAGKAGAGEPAHAELIRQDEREKEGERGRQHDAPSP